MFMHSVYYKNDRAKKQKTHMRFLFYAFVQEQKIDSLFEMVENFNLEQETKSNIHLAVMAVDRSNLN